MDPVGRHPQHPGLADRQPRRFGVLGEERSGFSAVPGQDGGVRTVARPYFARKMKPRKVAGSATERRSPTSSVPGSSHSEGDSSEKARWRGGVTRVEAGETLISWLC